jgi:hypothetical protein
MRVTLSEWGQDKSSKTLTKHSRKTIWSWIGNALHLKILPESRRDWLSIQASIEELSDANDYWAAKKRIVVGNRGSVLLPPLTSYYEGCWNVNGLERLLRADAFYAVVEKLGLDVLFLAETKISLDSVRRKFPGFEQRMKELGYVYMSSTWTTDGHYTEGYAGVALFAKFAPEEEIFGVGDSSLDSRGRVISARWSTGNWATYSYTPCSSEIYNPSVVSDRKPFDKALLKHYKRLSVG